MKPKKTQKNNRIYKVWWQLGIAPWIRGWFPNFGCFFLFFFGFLGGFTLLRMWVFDFFCFFRFPRRFGWKELCIHNGWLIVDQGLIFQIRLWIHSVVLAPEIHYWTGGQGRFQEPESESRKPFLYWSKNSHGKPGWGKGCKIWLGQRLAWRLCFC